MFSRFLPRLLPLCLVLLVAPAGAQTTVSITGRVADSTGAVVTQANVTAVNVETKFSRSTITNASGDYQLALLPVGEYTVTAEREGFKREVKRIHLDVGQVAAINFTLSLGQVTQEVQVSGVEEVVEPTRTMVSSVIAEREIETLPVNGRQFIDFALLAPGVAIGDTTSGSTDVIIEPVTKLSFAGQNIHYNFIAVDGADNISTASGVQKYTPSQEAVREFRVINSDYSTEFGRAVGGIINIITKSGTNDFHGSLYEYFRNDAMDATSPLASPGLNKLRQNQFGGTLGGPITKDRTFFFTNYEGQRRHESPFYNSIILANIDKINAFKAAIGFPLEPPRLDVTRTGNYDTVLFRVDHQLSQKHYLYSRYFFNDARYRNVSPLNDGFDLPSSFKDNFSRDHSIIGNLTSTLSGGLLNEVRGQYAHRFFDYPTVTSQPHMEVANQFTMGVNRGNPDFYEESRVELADNVTWTRSRHTVTFGGDFNRVSTTESFPLFYPFEATFVCIDPSQQPANPACGLFNLQNQTPAVLFFERFRAPNFDEPSFDTSVFLGSHYPDAVRNQAKGTLDHTYDGFFVQDKFRPTNNLTLTLGARFDFETWPSNVLDNTFNFDPRFGFAWSPTQKRNLVVRGGIGIFHGIIPSPLLLCQEPSCGGQAKYPGSNEDDLNAKTQLFGFASAPGALQAAFHGLVTSGTYPTEATGFLAPATIVRFAQDHKSPYGIQSSFGLEFEPVRDSSLSVSWLRVHGVHLGSFFNINQGPPIGQRKVVYPNGATFFKDVFGPGPQPFFLFFEANSNWFSDYNGLLVNFNKRTTHHIGMGVSYTWSKGIDNGPNPSFVLIPEDTGRFDLEKALSSDHVAHRFVANATLTGPTKVNPIVNDWQLGVILTLETPHYFTKFTGFDANGDGFPLNDRVGIERRNTFKGDGYQSADVRLSRTFNVTEKLHLEAIGEVFNLTNTLNVRFFNTVYGAPDFIPEGTPGTFKEGSPNPGYATPRAVYNPRQVQLAVRFTF